MVQRWMWFIAMLAAVRAADYNDDLYFRAPLLFYMDNMEECLRRPDGEYCMGSFDIIPQGNMELYEELKNVSISNKIQFNQTQVHRAYCISSRCEHTKGSTLTRFEDCVHEDLMKNFGFGARLNKINYCKTGAKPVNPPIDTLDIAFAGVILFILLMNFIGTVYDFKRDIKNKPYNYLLPWSLRYTWRRLTIVYDGDERLKALLPSNGVKSILSILVMFAHSFLAVLQPYISDVRFVNQVSSNPISIILQNGTIVVQTFISLASFLFSYNILVDMEKNKKQVSFMNIPALLWNRYIRLTPVVMLTVGLTATWWVHIARGPQWSLMVEDMRNVCRDKWWTHLLYINNMVKPDGKCMVQSWFMAVDMQVYLPVVILVVALWRRPRAALPVLGFLYLVSVAVNFTVNYYYSYIPMVQINTIDNIRMLYAGSEAFNWMYMAPWTSLPAAIAGVASAFLHYSLQQAGVKPTEYKIVFNSNCEALNLGYFRTDMIVEAADGTTKRWAPLGQRWTDDITLGWIRKAEDRTWWKALGKWLRVLYRLTIPACLLWLCSGLLFLNTTSRFLLAWYATFDRVIFNLLINVAIFGYFNQFDSIIWKFLSRREWQIPGRMSLSVTMVHWFFTSSVVAVHTNMFEVGFQSIFAVWVLTIIYSYIAAVPLHLLVEIPLQKILG